MPISKHKQELYPPEWETEIRPAILKRANNHCEWCGIENHTWLWRHPHDDCWHIWSHNLQDGRRWYGENATECRVFIRLTIAHIHDSDPSNCDPDNLAALCEACHNRHDAKMRVMNIIRRQNAEREAAGQLRLL
jgi:hypothetical protein